MESASHPDVEEEAITDEQDYDRDIEFNIIVLSSAGKPVFSRYGSEEDITRTCALIQAIQTSLDDPAMGFGEIQSLRSRSRLLVFANVGSLTLVACARRGKFGEVETAAYLQLHLEYVYSQLVFILTDQFQFLLLSNPSIDLRESLGAAEYTIRDLIDETNLGKHCGAFLLGGVQSVFPIAPGMREHASLVLSSVRDRAKDTVFALLLVDERLLSIVQPLFAPHQLRNSDLHLLIHNVNHQPGLETSELWFPVCLPRFHSTAFLYAYTNCLDVPTRLTLVLISQLNTTEQFQIFRSVAVDVRRSLGLPANKNSVLRVMSSIEDRERSPARVKGHGSDVPWKRSEDEGDETVSDDDSSYVNVDKALEIESLMATMSPDECSTRSECILLYELRRALDKPMALSALRRYCDTARASHFLFRLDVPLKMSRRRKGQPVGKLTQCVSSHFGSLVESASKRRILSTYQKLQLRLRLGSASTDSIALSRARNVQVSRDHEPVTFCTATNLIESAPNIQSISYVIDGPELLFAMNGKDFEIYMVVQSTVRIKDAANLCARLVHNLLEDETKLFLCSPVTWTD